MLHHQGRPSWWNMRWQRSIKDVIVRTLISHPTPPHPIYIYIQNAKCAKTHRPPVTAWATSHPVGFQDYDEFHYRLIDTSVPYFSPKKWMSKLAVKPHIHDYLRIKSPERSFCSISPWIWCFNPPFTSHEKLAVYIISAFFMIHISFGTSIITWQFSSFTLGYYLISDVSTSISWWISVHEKNAAGFLFHCRKRQRTSGTNYPVKKKCQ